mmetsp:Transcript_77895/g.232115  ORF Transcript_77895/g.232115 Transcript_77895/m.232115 type:complete len:85 (-) Transcript_77895:20-274(-)
MTRRWDELRHLRYAFVEEYSRTDELPLSVAPVLPVAAEHLGGGFLQIPLLCSGLAGRGIRNAAAKRHCVHANVLGGRRTCARSR